MLLFEGCSFKQNAGFTLLYVSPRGLFFLNSESIKVLVAVKQRLIRYFCINHNSKTSDLLPMSFCCCSFSDLYTWVVSFHISFASSYVQDG